MARYANKQNLRTLVEALRDEYQTPSWVKDAEELGNGLEVSDGTLSVNTTKSSDGPVDGPISELSAEGWATQFSTTGKNLLPNNATSQTNNGITFTVNADGSVSVNGTSTAKVVHTIFNGSIPAGTYVLNDGQDTNHIARIECNISGTYYYTTNGPTTITTEADTNWNVYIIIWKNNTVNTTIYPQLELGSTATEYEPYTGGAPSPSPDYPQEIEVVRGHEVTGKTGRFVSLEVRDSQDQLVSTTPIPLPERGWVGSLPDGTADILHLDGAGKVEWELGTNEVVLDGSSSDNLGFSSTIPCYWYSNSDGKSGIIANNVISNRLTYGNGLGRFWNSPLIISFLPFEVTSESTVSDLTTWLTTHNLVFYYPLATPVTESLGYIDLPDIPEGSTVSIPELDALGVTYLLDPSARDMAEQWYQRAYAELGDAVTELAERVAALEQ